MAPKKGSTRKVAKVEAGNPSWGWLLALGILFLITGFISLGMVVSVTLASMFFIGVLVLIAGVFQLVDVFKCHGWKAIAWHCLIALVYIYVGCLIIYDPFIASALITALLAWAFIVIGIFRVCMSFMLRSGQGWGWVLLAGLVSIILGAMILMQWPMSGLWVIGLLISIELIVSGWTTTALALVMRHKK